MSAHNSDIFIEKVLYQIPQLRATDPSEFLNNRIKLLPHTRIHARRNKPNNYEDYIKSGINYGKHGQKKIYWAEGIKWGMALDGRFMFGYITVNKMELKLREYETYKGFYCGLCRTLKKEYGAAGQLTLSYDMTFLSILLSSLYEPESRIVSGRCLLHPEKKRMMIGHEYAAYAAHMGILLTWYHFRDDWIDERKPAAIVGLRAYRRAYLRARELYPEKAAHIKRCLARLDALEKAGSLDIDRVAGVFGDLLGDVFAVKEDIWRNTLYNVGFFLGKFIYLMDAWDDMADDEQNGSYNILLLRKKKLYRDTDSGRAHFEQDCHRLLTMMMAECTAHMELLPCIRDEAILRNILYDGVWNRYRKRHSEREPVAPENAERAKAAGT